MLGIADYSSFKGKCDHALMKQSGEDTVEKNPLKIFMYVKKEKQKC